MLLLVRNVSGHGRNVRLAHAEHSISRLPSKIGLPISTHPTGRIRFDDARHLRRRLRGTNPHQHENVVGSAIDDKRRALHFADDPSEVGEEIIAKPRSDQRPACLRAEDQMDDDVFSRVCQGSSPLTN